MAKRRKARYSRLMQSLRDSGGSFDGNNGRTKKFLDHLTGKSPIKVENKISGEAQKTMLAAVLPFSFDIQGTPDATDRFEVGFGKYSYAGYEARIKTQLSRAELGWENPVAENRDGSAENFFPALVKVQMQRGAGNTVTKVSAVTGDSYETDQPRTFSLPFGRGLASSSETAKGGAAATDVELVEYETVKESIREKLTAPRLNGLKSVSFVPEVYRGRDVTGESVGNNPSLAGIDIN